MMHIHEAVQQAMAEGLAMRRKDWEDIAILPTNTRDCCYLILTGKVVQKHTIPMGRCWNPVAEDLTADDWELTPYKDKPFYDNDRPNPSCTMKCPPSIPYSRLAEIERGILMAKIALSVSVIDTILIIVRWLSTR